MLGYLAATYPSGLNPRKSSQAICPWRSPLTFFNLKANGRYDDGIVTSRKQRQPPHETSTLHLSSFPRVLM